SSWGSRRTRDVRSLPRAVPARPGRGDHVAREGGRCTPPGGGERTAARPSPPPPAGVRDPPECRVDERRTSVPGWGGVSMQTAGPQVRRRWYLERCPRAGCSRPVVRARGGPSNGRRIVLGDLTSDLSCPELEDIDGQLEEEEWRGGSGTLPRSELGRWIDQLTMQQSTAAIWEDRR
ncbi:hypothetical protein THAOC_17754, partial [Thalassiosira oceanica]